jgi:hypothetical protein
MTMKNEDVPSNMAGHRFHLKKYDELVRLPMIRPARDTRHAFDVSVQSVIDCIAYLAESQACRCFSR